MGGKIDNNFCRENVEGPPGELGGAAKYGKRGRVSVLIGGLKTTGRSRRRELKREDRSIFATPASAG